MGGGERDPRRDIVERDLKRKYWGGDPRGSLGVKERSKWGFRERRSKGDLEKSKKEILGERKI